MTPSSCPITTFSATTDESRSNASPLRSRSGPCLRPGSRARRARRPGAAWPARRRVGSPGRPGRRRSAGSGSGRTRSTARPRAARARCSRTGPGCGRRARPGRPRRRTARRSSTGTIARSARENPRAVPHETHTEFSKCRALSHTRQRKAFTHRACHAPVIQGTSGRLRSGHGRASPGINAHVSGPSDAPADRLRARLRLRPVHVAQGGAGVRRPTTGSCSSTWSGRAGRTSTRTTWSATPVWRRTPRTW